MIETEQNSNFNAVIIKIINEKYLLDVKDVKEIFIPGDKIVPVPLSNKSIVGLIDIRGEIYSIISLRQMIYSNEINDDLNENSRILLLERDNLKIALLVDSIIGISEIPYSIFTKKKSIIETNINSKLIKSIGVMNEMAYILLDLESLISPLLLTDISKTNSVHEVEFKPLPKIKSHNLIKTKSKPSVQKVAPIKVSTSRKKKPKSIKTVSKSKDIITLSENQHDTLKEIGNIGSGNAITALSRLIKKKIDVSLTDVGIISFDNLGTYLGNSNQKVCGIFSTIENTSTSTILQVFDLVPLLKLVEDLSENKLKTPISNIKSKSDLNEMTISTIKEMGNIMAGHYVSAIADLLGTKMLIDVPDFAFSRTASIGDFLLKEQKANIKFLISIKTSINIVDLKLNGMFFFIPDLITIENIFKKLNIDNKLISDQIKSISTKTTRQLEDEVLKNIKLTDIQRDALQEVGNIGAGNAANALARMIKKRVDIDIPVVEMVELDKFAKNISKRNTKLFVSWSNIIGKAKATIVSIFKLTDIIKIGSIITDGDYNYNSKDIKSVSDFSDLFESAISELGHILASHYASAIGDLLDMKMMTEPPDLSIDTGTQLFKILQDEIGLIKKLSLVITTNVIVSDIKITGTFLYIPDLKSLQDLLDKLALFYE